MKCPFCGAEDTQVIDGHALGEDAGDRLRRPLNLNVAARLAPDIQQQVAELVHSPNRTLNITDVHY